MRPVRNALCFLALCLLGCSCGEERGTPVSGRGEIAGGSPSSTGVAQAMRPVIIDTRSPQEYAAGHLVGALLMPHDAIGGMIEAQVPDRNTPIMLYCRSGGRAESARQTLVSMNYTNVENLGGMQNAADQLKKDVAR